MTLTIEKLNEIIASHDAIVAAGDTSTLTERLGDWLTDEIGPYAGTGTPADEDRAEKLAGDYICALDTGEIVAWGEEYVVWPGITSRRIVVE